MSVLDKASILTEIARRERVHLELGCGANKRTPSAIGIDMLDYPCVDLVGDVYEALQLFPDHSVDSVSSFHFIEHVPDVNRLLTDLARVLKIGGIARIVAPHFSNPYFYSDLTHNRFFGLYTFDYYATNSHFSRKVPTYDNKIQFEISSVDLIFKSSRPFYFRHGFKKLFGSLFNSSNFMKELYEENFCYLFPCYEVSYLLTRKPAHQNEKQ